MDSDGSGQMFLDQMCSYVQAWVWVWALVRAWAWVWY